MREEYAELVTSDFEQLEAIYKTYQTRHNIALVQDVRLYRFFTLIIRTK